MNVISQTYRQFYKVICWILALHLLNYSIDPPSHQSINTSGNEVVESITELVAEVIFCYEAPFRGLDDHVNSEGDFVDAFEFFSSTRSLYNHQARINGKLSFPKVGPDFLIPPDIGILVPPPRVKLVS